MAFSDIESGFNKIVAIGEKGAKIGELLSSKVDTSSKPKNEPQMQSQAQLQTTNIPKWLIPTGVILLGILAGTIIVKIVTKKNKK